MHLTSASTTAYHVALYPPPHASAYHHDLERLNYVSSTFLSEQKEEKADGHTGIYTQNEYNTLHSQNC